MGELLVKDKEIVVPGQELANGMDFLPAGSAFRDDDKIISSQIGIVSIDNRLIRVIPLKGKYTPKRNDVVIGKILDMSFNNWYVDIDCATNAVLSSREATEFVERGADLSQYYSYGDLIVAKVSNVTRTAVELSMRGPGLRKLGPGRIIKVEPSKVPRVIGKAGSMITLVKEKTICRITVGQNGLVWIQGEPQNELIATEAIRKINNESHKEGLTNEIAKFLDERTAGLKSDVKSQVPKIEEKKGELHEINEYEIKPDDGKERQEGQDWQEGKADTKTEKKEKRRK